MLLKSFPSLSLLLVSTAAIALPDLPEPVSNNAVASTHIRGKTYVLSATGLGPGKTSADIHNKAWLHTVGEFGWTSLPAVPSQQRLSGRIGASAVALNNNFFIFGGSFVAADGTAVTANDGYRLDPVTRRYTRLNDMPVPVDHAAAVAYQNRYVYLVSGWSDHGAVNLVQLFDNFTQRWSQATPFPGKPVYGLAGAIAAHHLVVCDGVTLTYPANQQRQRSHSAACWSGALGANPNVITWQEIPHPTGKARYRMAATAVTLNGEEIVAFIGGSDTAYSLNAIGYQGELAEPSAAVWLFSPRQQRWLDAADTTAVMDLRGVVELDGAFYSLGGMIHPQQVTNKPIKHQIKLLPE